MSHIDESFMSHINDSYVTASYLLSEGQKDDPLNR